MQNDPYLDAMSEVVEALTFAVSGIMIQLEQHSKVVPPGLFAKILDAASTEAARKLDRGRESNFCRILDRIGYLADIDKPTPAAPFALTVIEGGKKDD